MAQHFMHLYEMWQNLKNAIFRDINVNKLNNKIIMKIKLFGKHLNPSL